MTSHTIGVDRALLAARIDKMKARLDEVSSPIYVTSINGTIGADPYLVSLVTQYKC